MEHRDEFCQGATNPSGRDRAVRELGDAIKTTGSGSPELAASAVSPRQGAESVADGECSEFELAQRGADGDDEAPSDHGLANSSSPTPCPKQVVHGRVRSPGSFVDRAGRAGPALRRRPCRRACWSCCWVWAPAGSVRDHGLLHRGGQAVPQMPPVADLNRLRCALADRLGISGRAVAADVPDHLADPCRHMDSITAPGLVQVNRAPVIKRDGAVACDRGVGVPRHTGPAERSCCHDGPEKPTRQNVLVLGDGCGGAVAARALHKPGSGRGSGRTSLRTIRCR
jgi:hypothetical protein